MRVGISCVKVPAYIILLNWNGWRDTIKCISSLKLLDYQNYKVVVVDNASSDNSIEQIGAAHPDVQILRSEENVGFARGNNIGIRYALSKGAEYIWVLNNDTIVDAHALTAMVETAESDKQIGAVGSIIYYMDEPNKIQNWGGGRVYMFFGILRPLVSAGNLDFISGASILLKRQILEELGLICELFFFYWEDVELCYRIKWKYSIRVATNSKVWHRYEARKKSKNKATRKSLIKYSNASPVIFFRMHSKLCLFPILIGSTGRLLKQLKRLDFQGVISLIGGVIMGLKTNIKQHRVKSRKARILPY